MLSGQTLVYVIYAVAAAAVVLLIEAFYLQVIAVRRAHSVNHRLDRLAREVPQEDALKSLLRERGLTATGDYVFGMVSLNRLYLQSGVTSSPGLLTIIFIAIGVVTTIVLRFAGVSLGLSVAFGVALFVVLPLLYLRRRRAKRIRTFERQLPDALDMVVRSLKAGHPTSVAISMVAREMQDPIGTEFGIATDEVTFGADLESAMRKMAERVGFEGLHLLSVAINIQSKTGGNLTEILQNLSGVLRERLMLRLKIRALSAEGRLSAILISLFPVAMFLILLIIAPSYYGAVWGSPIIFPAFAIFGGLALLGDYIMYRMVTFDF